MEAKEFKEECNDNEGFKEYFGLKKESRKKLIQKLTKSQKIELKKALQVVEDWIGLEMEQETTLNALKE